MRASRAADRREAEKTWGVRVYERREVLGISQAQVVRAAAGKITQQTISKVENNEILPRPTTMKVLAGALGISIEELFPWVSYEATLQQVKDNRDRAAA